MLRTSSSVLLHSALLRFAKLRLRSISQPVAKFHSAQDDTLWDAGLALITIKYRKTAPSSGFSTMQADMESAPTV